MQELVNKELELMGQAGLNEYSFCVIMLVSQDKQRTRSPYKIKQINKS